MTSIIHKGNGVIVNSFAYDPDPVGNRIATRTPAGNRSFVYDDNGQVTSSTSTEPVPARPEEVFAYDAVANRVSDKGGSYVYQQNGQGKNTDRVIEDYRYQYFYDEDGNLAKKISKENFPNGEVTNFSYSSENQLIGFRVYGPNSSIPIKEVTYAYDPLGRRVQKQVIDHATASKSFTRRYGYDGENIVLEYDGDSQILARYTHSGLAADDVLAVSVTQSGVTEGLARNEGSYQYLKDGLGSITDVTSSTGTKLQHYVYSVFGELLGIQDAQANDVTANPVVNTSYTFTGRELDSESGYYYYRARYYDSGTGRFLQRDPEPGKLNVPVTVVNGYVYVANNPQNLTDPTGKFFWFIIAAFALVGAVSNLSEALKVPGASFGQILGSTLFGALAGAVNGVATVLGGPLAGILSSAITSGFNNAVNQSIFTGSVEMDNVWGAAFTGGLTAGLGSGVGSLFSKQLTELGMSVVGSTVGTGAGSFFIDSGIPTQDECSNINTLCYQYNHH